MLSTDTGIVFSLSFVSSSFSLNNVGNILIKNTHHSLLRWLFNYTYFILLLLLFIIIIIYLLLLFIIITIYLLLLLFIIIIYL
jgi:hypothetical protein